MDSEDNILQLIKFPTKKNVRFFLKHASVRAAQDHQILKKI